MIYFEELAHAIIMAEKAHNLQSANWTQESQRCNSVRVPKPEKWADGVNPSPGVEDELRHLSSSSSEA